MPDEIPGINMLVEVDGTAVIAQSNATLSTSTELAEAIVKSTNFRVQNHGDQDWSLSYEGQITDSAGKHALANGNASLAVGSPSLITDLKDTSGDGNDDTFVLKEDRSNDWSSGDTVRVYHSTGNDQEYTIDSINGTDVTVVESISDSTADGQMFKPETVPGLQTLSLGLEQELSQTPPGIDEPTGWSYYTPLRRAFTVEAGGHYYDPANESTYETIHTARDNGENLAFALVVFGVTFVGEIAADTMDIEAGTDDNASYSLAYAGSNELVKEGTAETTIDSLLSLFFNQSEATASLRHKEGGSTVSGSTFWTGTTLLSTLDIELERNAHPSLSTELQGDGSLSRNTN